MARKEPADRKRRTREHVIADLSVNHIEKQALLCTFVARRVFHDYGFDLMITTFNDSGEFENGEIRVQLKATDRPQSVAEGQFFAVRIDTRDLRHWLLEPMPVILALYDALNDTAYWLYAQDYLSHHPELDLDRIGSVTMRVPRSNVVSPASFRVFASYRDKMLSRMRG